MVKIFPDEFKVWSQYVSSVCGIQLDVDKAYLFENRFVSLLESTGSSSFLELYNKVKSDPTRVLQTKVIDAITTNETSFFRDGSPFELLKHKILPDLIDRRNKDAPRCVVPIRIWSAGCSTGQEVYSIAIVLKELLGTASQYSLRVLGTDISDSALMQASRGTYGSAEIERGLTEEQRNKYFVHQDGGWKVTDQLRALVSFRPLNLLGDLGPIGKFDVIFCRNVAIYFAEAEKKKLFTKLSTALDEDGVIIIGSTESLLAGLSEFEPKRYLSGVYYQRKPKKMTQDG